MQPQYYPGDIVIKRTAWAGFTVRPRVGTVIAARRANSDNRLDYVYPYVYYVLFADGGLEGPMYPHEFHDAK